MLQRVGRPLDRPALGSRVSAKVSPPAATASHVSRAKVWEAVARNPAAKLILVQAPAGFGKTTAMAQIRARLEEDGAIIAWLTLDGADNDVARFLECLSAAVPCHDAFPEPPPALADPALARGAVTLDIFERLARLPAPFALFLDDFETIHDPMVLSLVADLIDHLAPSGQVVIGSRARPDLRLSRMRARGELIEIDAELLRFSMEETEDFLIRYRALPLATEELALLHGKTEGWVVALRLASIALERREAKAEFIAAFSGSDQTLSDYLAEDVLARMSKPVRGFLLRTSILRDLNASLCDAVTGAPGSASILAELEAAGIFLSQIEGDARTYRYHSLFAGFLRTQLAAEAPGELAALHRAAARWYESDERPVPAIEHLIEAADWPCAVDLIARHADPLLGEGRMRLLARWFTALPQSELRTRPVMTLIHAWALCFTRGPAEAMALLEASGRQGDDPETLAHATAMRPVLLAMMDRHEEAYEVGRKSVLLIPTGKTFADSVLANSMATIVSVMGQDDEARKLLDIARRTQSEAVGAFNMMYSEAAEGIIDLREGRIQQANARFRAAATHEISRNRNKGNAWAGVLQAGALYEANECEQAERLLRVHVPLAKDCGLPDHLILGYIMLSRLAYGRGDADRAHHLLTELEYTGHQRRLPRVAAGAKLERARLLLLQGHAKAARNELDRARDRELWSRVERLHLLANDVDYYELAELRWQILAGRPEEALDRLGNVIRAAEAGSRRRRALKLRLLHSMALDRSGDEAGAHAEFGQVLRIAHGERLIRFLIDEGEGARALIRRYGTTAGLDPDLAAYLQRLLSASGPEPADRRPTLGSQPAEISAEALTRAEMRVLHLLAEGLSNTAMAEKLFVSDSTVRTHLRSINAKLNASNRTQAVAIARRTGMVR
jgi:LuxR family maltose regulon positive regulatory protein